ncbi:hypothetical protein DV735_g3215, partial [Chaetothyriales sp. CBS 134920]
MKEVNLDDSNQDRSDFIRRFFAQHTAVAESVTRFASIPSTNRWLSNPLYKTIPTFCRHLKHRTDEDLFFARTINTPETVPHMVSLVRNDLPARSQRHRLTQAAPESVGSTPVSVSQYPDQPDLVVLVEFGPAGVDGHPSIVHGGVCSAILDESMSLVILLHNLYLPRSEAPGGTFTANLNLNYRAPVTSPGQFAVKCWLRGRERRKWFTRGVIVDSQDRVLIQADAIWVTPVAERSRPMERQRAAAAYNPLHSYRLTREEMKQYEQQFGDMYFLRLAKLKPVVERIAEEAWFDFEIAGEQAQRVERVLDVRQGHLCWVVGTIYMDMPLKPSILEDISREHWVAAPPPRQSYRSADGEVQVMLEDESGRLRLTGSALRSNMLVTGVIVAVLGTENAQGDFDVLDMHMAELPPQPRRWQRDDQDEDDGMAIDRPTRPGKKIALLSGLSFSGSEADTLTLALLAEFLLGECLDDPDQASAAQICHLVIAGNSISSATLAAEAANPHDEARKPAHKKYGYDASAYNPTPTTHLDQYLSELLPSLPITLMPGEHDPANISLPQQPIHPAMFPRARNYASDNLDDPQSAPPGWFDCTTNPASFDIDGYRFLGTSGQNIDDIYKYLPTSADDHHTDPDSESRLDVLEATLRWRCVAPTAPDTLWCYPFQTRDQFVLDECPHVYFVGNQPRFETAVVHGPDHQRVRLLTLPLFKTTGELVLVDADTLDVEIVKFQVP